MRPRPPAGTAPYASPSSAGTAADDAVVLDTVIKGDTVREVMNYVQFDADVLTAKLRSDVEAAVRGGHLGYEQSGRLLRFFEEGLNGYTYLEEHRPADRSVW